MGVILLIIVGIIVYKCLKAAKKTEQTINRFKEKEDWEGLLKYCRKLLQSNHSSVNLSLTIAYAYLKTHEYCYCINRCEEILKQSKDNEEALYLKGLAFSELFMYEASLKNLERAQQIVTDKNKKQEYENIIEKIKDRQQAEQPFELPINYNTFTVSQKERYIKARQAEKEGNWQKAKELSGKLPVNTREDFQMMRFYANLLYQLGEYSDAKLTYGMIKYHKGNVLTQEEEARCHYMDALSDFYIIKDSDVDFREIIDGCYRISRYGEKALTVCPSFEPAKEIISQSKQMLYDRVIKYMENYIMDNPYDGEECAYSYINICEKLLKYEKDNLQYLYLMAQLYYIQGEFFYEDAEKTLKKILKINSNDKNANILLSKIIQEQNVYEPHEPKTIVVPEENNFVDVDIQKTFSQINISSCSYEEIISLLSFDTEKAQRFIEERNNGKMWYDIDSFAQDFHIQPHEMIELKNYLIFPLKQNLVKGRKIDF